LGSPLIPQPPRDHFEIGTSIGCVCLMLGPRAVEDIRPRSRCSMLVYECACNNIKMLVVFMVFYRAHPISGVPLNQHR